MCQSCSTCSNSSQRRPNCSDAPGYRALGSQEPPQRWLFRGLVSPRAVREEDIVRALGHSLMENG